MRTEHKQSQRQPFITLRGCEAKWLLSVTQEGRPCILSSSKFEALKVYFMTFKNSSQWLITASKAPCKTQWFFIIFDCSYKSMSNCQCRFIRKFSLFRQLTWIDHIEILTGVLQTRQSVWVLSPPADLSWLPRGLCNAITQVEIVK